MEASAGRVYAEALEGAAGDTDTLERALDDLTAIVQCRDELPEFGAFLNSPRIPVESKQAVLQRVFGPHVHDLSRRFLMVLLKHGRQDALADVVATLRDAVDRRRNRLRVLVRTALPADDRPNTASAAGGLAALREHLAAATGLEVIFETETDPELLGGIVIGIGDTRIDGSLRRRLAGLGAQLHNTRIGSSDCYED